MESSRLHLRVVVATAVALALGFSASAAVTQILGQPTDRSITVNARSDSALEIYFEYGVASGVYTAKTASAVMSADPYAASFFVAQAVMANLLPDTRYFYRTESRAAGSSAAFAPGSENTFHTQRRPGSAFVFGIQGDSHPERPKQMFDAALYTQTLTAAAKDQPDFYIMSGDDFSVDTLQPPYTQSAITGRYALQLPWLDTIARSSPLFLVTGNHEQTSLYNFTLPPDANNTNKVPVWAQNARNLYYPEPAPDDPVTGTFYSGNSTSVPGIGLLRDYYAWQWGDALFVVIDPYWTSPVLADNPIGGADSGGKTGDRWLITHGDPQYAWLKQTLEQSSARWKFVFAHHVMGTGRGGVEVATQYEWGGKNTDGSWGFANQRPAWPATIHQLFVANHVTVFFQGHDHLFAHQELDGVTYQEVPNPADFTYTAFNSASYKSGDVLPNSGYLRVAVSASSVKVDYVREYLPKDETSAAHSGDIAFSYSISAPSIPRRRAVGK